MGIFTDDPVDYYSAELDRTKSEITDLVEILAKLIAHHEKHAHPDGGDCGCSNHQVARKLLRQNSQYNP